MARILVADDETGLRAFVVEVLAADGHQVFQCADGAEAVERALRERFDLLITDLKMPRLDGLVLLRRLRAARVQMPVIVMTAHGSVDSAVEAMKLGAIDYLEKPVKSPAALRALVSRVLGRRAATPDRSSRPAAGALRELTAALADRYAVDREVGRGGMALVFLAQDLRYERKVAVKVLRPEMARYVGGERFLREVAIVARLTHPHILPLVDSGEVEDTSFYVMPFAEGGSLRQWIDRNRTPSMPSALLIVCQVGAALDYAHGQGFVHRDVKPENILFTDGLPVVADFGIARAITMAAGDALTEVGVTVGTPEYMSPEQVAGDQLLEGRSDEYSLAVLLFEMLTGAPPFAGVSARAVMGRHLNEAPPLLRARRPDAPKWLEQVVHRALAKDPADRFPTVAEFVEALGYPRAVTLNADGHLQPHHEVRLTGQS
jgi:FixJ family two-component response regulator